VTATLPLALLRQLQVAAPAPAWSLLARYAFEACETNGTGLPPDTAARVRDEALRALDTWLAGAGWDLWCEFGTAMPRTADHLIAWWDAIPTGTGAAVLIVNAGEKGSRRAGVKGNRLVVGVS